MAKSVKPTKNKPPPKPAAPDHLTMWLFAPGMTPLHRAGLGGLACTLKYIERAYQQGALSDDDVPGGPWNESPPPWDIKADQVTLRFGQPEQAGDYLKRLFALAFPIKDGLIYLPGQYGQVPPPLAVRAESQTALVRTFLQGAKKNVGLGSWCQFSLDPDGTGTSTMTIEYQRCEWYKQQEEWENLVDKNKSTLLPVPKPTNIGSFNPGAIVRHSASGFGNTAITESTSIVVPSLFFVVGCIPLRLNSSGDGILLIPEAANLEAFTADRPVMTPSSPREVRIAGLGDAALQALVRLRSKCLLTDSSLPSVIGSRFSMRTWTRPQKSRVLTIHVESEMTHRFAAEEVTRADHDLDRFELALALFPPRIHNPNVKKTTGPDNPGTSRKRRPTASVGEAKVESYWIESLVRPFIADNLAQGRDWYADFLHLVNSSDAAKKIGYEKKGLQVMATNSQFTTDQERRFIRVLHRAMARIRGKIYRDTLGDDAAKRGIKPTQAVFNRWNRLGERLRLSLVSAKTRNQVQATISELLSRRGHIKELRDDETFAAVHEFLFHEQWERVRNLALFALASYKRPPDEEAIEHEDLDDNESK